MLAILVIICIPESENAKLLFISVKELILKCDVDTLDAKLEKFAK